jgi:hypothetical protein
MIRGVDGTIVPNTEENRHAISDMESGWRRQPAPQSPKARWENWTAERQVIPEICDTRRPNAGI